MASVMNDHKPGFFDSVWDFLLNDSALDASERSTQRTALQLAPRPKRWQQQDDGRSQRTKSKVRATRSSSKSSVTNWQQKIYRPASEVEQRGVKSKWRTDPSYSLQVLPPFTGNDEDSERPPPKQARKSSMKYSDYVQKLPSRSSQLHQPIIKEFIQSSDTYDSSSIIEDGYVEFPPSLEPMSKLKSNRFSSTNNQVLSEERDDEDSYVVGARKSRNQKERGVFGKPENRLFSSIFSKSGSMDAYMPEKTHQEDDEALHDALGFAYAHPRRERQREAYSTAFLRRNSRK